MSFNVPLTNDQYTLLRSGQSACDYMLALCQNQIVLAGTINDDLSVGQVWAQFEYTATDGDYTDVDADMVLLISSTDDILTARYQGRVRFDYDAATCATATTLYVNESSENFSAGAYFWVLYTWEIDYKLSRPTLPDAVEEVDYSTPYQPPEPMVLGLRTAYFGLADSGTGKMRVAFDVSDSYATVSGGTITDYQFTFEDGMYTVISGALDSDTVTVDFDPGEQWGKLLITQSNGQTKYRRFYIRVVDADHPADLYFSDPQISGSLDSGWTLTTTAFAGVDSVLNNTFCVVARINEMYGGNSDSLYPDNNIAFVGWLQREDDTAEGTFEYGVTEDAKFEFTGIVPRMNRLAAQLLGFTISASPTIWGELVSLTPWRAICHFLSRYSTVANLCDVDFSSKDDTFLFSAISTQGGNIKAAVEGIAWQITALLESAPDGHLQVNRSAEFLSQDERDALPVVADFITEDVLRATRTLEQNNSVGKIDGDGAVYNSVNGEITVFASRAPGIAQGEAQGSDTLPAQILASTTVSLDALTELEQRAGDKNVAANNTEVLTVDFPDGYAAIFVPSKAQLFTFTLSALTANGVNRIEYDDTIQWTLETIQLSHKNEDGSTTCQGTFRRLLPPGSKGDNTTQIPQNSVLDPIPDLGLPAFDFELPGLAFPELGLTLGELNPLQLQPPPGQVADLKGGTLIVKNASQSFLLRNYIALTTPQSSEVTPSAVASGDIEAVLFDPFSGSDALGAYHLISDANTSLITYCDDITVPFPVSSGETYMTGEYNVLRAANGAGKVLAYAPSLGSLVTPGNNNFVLATDGWTPVNTHTSTCTGGNSVCTYTPGTGFVSVDAQTFRNANGCRYQETLEIQATFDGIYNIKSVHMDMAISGIFSWYRWAYDAEYLNTSDVWVGLALSGTAEVLSPTTYTNKLLYSWFGAGQAMKGFRLYLKTGPRGATWPAPDSYPGTMTVSLITMDATLVTPITGGNATVAYSSDYGETVSTVAVGTSPGTVGGFDTQRSGTVSYAGVAEAVYKATTLGGAYSSFVAFTGANPVCVIIPYYRRNSTTTKQTSATDPDLIVALDQADSGGGTLYFVDGATGTKNNITPVAGATFDNPNCVTIYYGKYITCTPKVSGVYKLYRSVDAGSNWTFIKNLTSPHFIRGRRGDTSVLSGYGQLYVTNGNSVDFSRTFGSGGTSTRNMPATGIDGFDIAG